MFTIATLIKCSDKEEINELTDWEKTSEEMETVKIFLACDC